MTENTTHSEEMPRLDFNVGLIDSRLAAVVHGMEVVVSRLDTYEADEAGHAQSLEAATRLLNGTRLLHSTFRARHGYCPNCGTHTAVADR